MLSVRVRFKTNLNVGMGGFSAKDAREKRIKAERKERLRERGGSAQLKDRDGVGEGGATLVGSNSTSTTGPEMHLMPNANNQMNSNVPTSTPESAGGSVSAPHVVDTVTQPPASPPSSPDTATPSLPNLLFAIDSTPTSLALLDMFYEAFADILTRPDEDPRNPVRNPKAKPKTLGKVFVVYVDGAGEDEDEDREEGQVDGTDGKDAERSHQDKVDAFLLGRGWSLADDVGETEIGVTGWGGQSGASGRVRTLRPLRDVTDEEIGVYLRMEGLSSSSASTTISSTVVDISAGPFSSGASLAHSTLSAVSYRLINTLTAGFPSTANTVSKTAEKVASAEWWLSEDEKGNPGGRRMAKDGCAMCLSPYRPNWSSWRAAHILESILDVNPSSAPVTESQQPQSHIPLTSSLSSSLFPSDCYLCHSCHSALRDAAKIAMLYVESSVASSDTSGQDFDRPAFTLPVYAGVVILGRTAGVNVNTHKEFGQNGVEAEEEDQVTMNKIPVSRDDMREELKEWLVEDAE
ncbi:hypothetical protein HDU93_001555 [Gonapodya sp. JEL0774]|nr:hypothetical protein HDU93_001555 [Gonapodya sp. JEL0774]